MSRAITVSEYAALRSEILGLQKDLDKVDWQRVYEQATSAVNKTLDEGYVDDDTQHYLYEAVMTAIYGNFWSAFNRVSN